jgi:hypothetical protein
VEHNLGRSRKEGKSGTKSAAAGSKHNVQTRRGIGGKGTHDRATRAAQSGGRGRKASISAVTTRILADRERAKYQQQQQVRPPRLLLYCDNRWVMLPARSVGSTPVLNG